MKIQYEKFQTGLELEKKKHETVLKSQEFVYNIIVT